MTETEDFGSIWSTLNEKLDRNWRLNRQLIRNINLDKASRKMNTLIWIKSIATGFYAICTFLLVSYAISRWQVNYQAITGIILAIWALAICFTSLHEVSLMARINFAESIPDLQKKLAEIKLTMIRYLRLATWILPLYFGFVILFFDVILGVDIVAVGDRTWIIASLVTGIVVFLPVTIWMHRKLTPKNADKKWMNNLLRGNGSQIADAASLLEEMKEYEKE